MKHRQGQCSRLVEIVRDYTTARASLPQGVTLTENCASSTTRSIRPTCPGKTVAKSR